MKNYKIFRKNGNYLFKIAIVFIVAMASSCDSNFLNEDLKEAPGPANVLTNTAGFEGAVLGLYDLQRAEYFDPGQCAGEAYGIFQTGLDISLSALHHGCMQNLELLGSNVQPATYSSFWNWGYEMVGNANQIISALDNKGINWDKPTDRNEIEAVARFFRAYSYRTMMYAYGPLPLVKELIKPFRNDYTRAPISEIQDLIINDLKFAAANLPATTTNDGALVKAAAQHYLGEMYLYTNKPDLAEIELKKITESGNYKLMTTRYGNSLNQPGDVFSDMFKTGNANRSKGNLEGIWVQQWEFDVIGGAFGGGWESPWDRRDQVPFYSSVKGFILADSLGGRGIGRIRPMKWWVDSYEAQDIRNSEFNIRRKWYYNNPALPDLFGKLAPITDASRINGSLYEATTKFNFGVTARNPTLIPSLKDKYIIRLADTWLLLAEAQMKQNKLTDASASINKIRNRAGATPVASGAVTMDYILNERARELYGEEARRFTLIRTGKFMERVLALNAAAAPNFKPFNQLLPIPQTAIDANTGAKLEQNPGY